MVRQEAGLPPTLDALTRPIKNETRTRVKSLLGAPNVIVGSASRRSARKLEALRFWREARPEDRRVERVLEAVAHERRIFVFDVHIEFADVRREQPAVASLTFAWGL